MKSNYKKIGDYIRLVDERNAGYKVKTLLGLSISKQFIPSVANIIGTDMENYKIIRKNQFACSTMQVRRDKKMPVALLKDVDEALISQAYPIFEVTDSTKLLPEYLMMWFTRQEFDREACFYAIGGVRGSLEWEDFCDMQLSIPHPDKQREILKEYNTIANRIALNNQLIQKLEETAQAIYKQWFVDFEFPNNQGKPYKSNGGEMEINAELEKEIPKGWRGGVLSDIANIIMGQSPEGASYNNEKKGMIFYQGRTDFGNRFPDISTYTTAPTRKAKQGDILVSVRAPVGDLNIAIQDCCIGRGVAALRSKTDCNSFLFYTMQSLKSQFNVSNDEGTVFGSINKNDLHGLKVLISESEIKNFDKLVSAIDKSIILYSQQNKVFIGVINLLLSKLATIEN